MLFDFANVLVFLALAVLFAAAILIAGRFFRPRVAEVNKDMAYECGERPVGNAWIQFNFRFYLVAIVFVIFDVEIAFIYPVAVVFKDWVNNGLGLFALVEIVVFIGILFVGLVYVWAKGDFEWLKRVSTTSTEARPERLREAA